MKVEGNPKLGEIKEQVEAKMTYGLAFSTLQLFTYRKTL